MLKKYLSIILSLALFCLNFNIVYAYDFIDPSNESKVTDKTNEIFNSKEQYEDLVGMYEETDINPLQATSSSYWWPIGSVETTEVDGKTFATGDPETITITSEFGYRDDPFGRGSKVFHSGLDIAGGSGAGNVNIIAARDGVVVSSSLDGGDNCPSGTGLDSCGGGYGNVVIIQHSDGNYTLYAHMYPNTITVKAGESVKQGQVIGKMGSSGYSTGPHLHFEVREGFNASKSASDPLTYISAENPRIVISGGEFMEWLNSWEGSTGIDGDSYIVVDIGDKVRTVGAGVTLEYNKERFAAHGININDYPEGSKIPINIVDQIKYEIVASMRSNVETLLAQNSITLKETQIQALVSQRYNCGNLEGFVDAYKTYGDTEEFFDNWLFRYIEKGTQFEQGLIRRRNAEWTLFHTGEYLYNG